MLDKRLEKHIDLLLDRYPGLNTVRNEIINAYMCFEECYQNGGKLLVAGNGGSASDAEHIVGELMKSFKIKRKVDEEFAGKLRTVDPENGEILANNLEGTLKAVALVCHESLSTAVINDVDGQIVYAQQLYGLADKEDVFLAISTSGNSTNVIYAAIVAKAKGMKVVGLTGRDGGRLSQIADITVVVPEQETYIIQEYHLPIYHCWCMMLEDKFFGKES